MARANGHELTGLPARDYPIRRLRDLIRYRRPGRGAHRGEDPVEKLLEDACIKLSVMASDIFGVSGQA